MKYLWLFAMTLLLVASSSGQSKTPEKIGFTYGLQRSYNTLKGNLKEAAHKMPESDYGFKPAPDAWSFGRLMGHIANTQFSSCASAKGQVDPNQGNDNEQKATKAEFIEALDDSFAYCDQVFASLTDDSATQFVTQRSNELTRGLVLANTISHSNEMYGIGVVYMSFKGFSVGPMHGMEMEMHR